MAKPQSDNMVRNVLDRDENKRFTHFRKTYVHKNQTEAAKLMGLSQGSLSYVETYKRPVPSAYYHILANRFNLNEEWLRKGEGVPQRQGVPVKNNLTTLVEMGSEITTLKRSVAVLQANQNLLIAYVERLIKTLAEHGVKTPEQPTMKH